MITHPIVVIQVAVRDEDLAGAAVVVRANNTTRFELADEFSCTLITDLEVVAQHHRGDGRAIGQKSDGFLIKWVAVRDGWRDDSNILGGDIYRACRWRC